MSKPKPNHNTQRFNRLRDLFGETLSLQPEPGGDSGSAGDSATNGNGELTSYVEIEGQEEGGDPPFLQLQEPEPDASPDPMQDQGGISAPRWEHFLDAIQRDEHLAFTYFSKAREVLNSSTPTNDGLNATEVRDGEPHESKLSALLQSGDEDFGSIELEGSPEQPWTEMEADLVNSVAQQVALHLENLRLLHQAEQFKQEAEQAVRRITRKGWEDFIQSKSNPVEGFVYDQTRVIPLESDFSLDRGVEDNGADHGISPDCRATAWPIKVREEMIGELVVEPSPDSPQDNLASSRLTEEVAGRLSTHIESLRLLEETERARLQLDRHAAELETVARVSTASATILDPAILLQSVVNLTKDSFALYGAHIYMMEAHAGRLVMAAMAGSPVTPGNEEPGSSLNNPQRNKHVIPLETGNHPWEETDTDPAGKYIPAIAKAARMRSGLIIEDVRSQPGYQIYPHLPNAVSELAVPMIVGDQVIGVFGVLSERPKRFFPEDMRTFTTLASQVGIALRNAELYAEQMATVARLRELDHLKSAFLANMSHELRTPLNSILGFTQVILEELDGPLTDDMQNDLQLIHKNGNHLLQLINDVLDMAKIEAGRMSLSFENFNLRELLQDVLETAGPLARDKSLYLKLMVNPLEPLEIIADQFRMRQILLNLVGNSVKFTENGGITLLAEQWEDTILLSIHDTGIGIPPDKLESIFEAFSQVDSSTTRKAGGTGLGLPISRRLVEIHGGRLWAESSGKPGEGSTFFLELPIDARRYSAGTQATTMQASTKDYGL